MSNVYFKPSDGDDYKSGKRFGKRVMILGESHYQWDRKSSRLRVDCHLCRQPDVRRAHPRVLDAIVGAFMGHKPDLTEKQSFWRSVAFYNYVQQSAGFGSHVGPRVKCGRAVSPASPRCYKSTRLRS